jgi:alkylated DNA nucleotide flippase Atl1
MKWWRVIQSDGKLNPKFPGGIGAHRKNLEAEGFKITQAGKTSLVVEDFEWKLAKL